MRVRFAPSPTGAAAHRRRAHGTLQLAAGPKARAARWCCASRTPTASAPRPRTWSRSSTPCAGWSSTGTRGRSRRSSGRPATASRSTGCWPTAHAYEDDGAVRLRVPDEGETVVSDVIRGDVTLPALGHRRLRDRPLGRQRALQPGRRRGRPGHGHRPRGPRRGPPLQHAAPGDDPRRRSAPSRRSTPTCRCCTGPTARSSPSATARRRCRSCASQGYLPEAVRNYIALLGWGLDDATTFITTES